MWLPDCTFRRVHAVCCQKSWVESFLQHILSRHVDMFYSVTGLVCHYSQLRFKLRTQIILERIQVLQQHFQCHNQYYICRTVSVRKHTATLCTATSVLLLLGVLQCCDQHRVPGVPHHIPYRTGIRGTYQKYRTFIGICLFVTEIMWHLYRSKFCEPISTFLSHE